MNKESSPKTNANVDVLGGINEVGSSIGSFFTISYGIVLTLSISYNIGYFRHLQPQIVNLMTLSDYINGTIHNIWFFLIFIKLWLIQLLSGECVI